MIRRGNAIRKAKRMTIEGHLTVEPTEIPTKFQVVQTGNQNSKNLVDVEDWSCTCVGHLMTGKICYHKAAVELDQAGIKEKKKIF